MLDTLTSDRQPRRGLLQYRSRYQYGIKELPLSSFGIKAPEPRTIGPVSFMDINQDALITQILERSEKPRLFTALNALSLSLALENSRLCRVLNESFTCFCDGYGIHVCHRIFEEGKVHHRTTPTDWIADLFTACAREGRKVFLLGDRPQVIEAFRDEMNQRFPKVVCGYHHGFFKSDSPEEFGVVEIINKSGADILLVGMGMPLQEFWTDRHSSYLRVSSILMIGASMSFLTGFRKRGPKWATDHGLEWFFRLLYEPLTMGPRYLIRLPKLLAQLLKYYRKADFRFSENPGPPASDRQRQPW